MSHGARTRLAAFVLCLALGIPGAAGAQTAGTAWTDPPTRTPEAAKAPSVAPAVPSTPAASSAPKVVAQAPRPAKAMAARPAPQRSVVVRRTAPPRTPVAAVPRRARLVAAHPVRTARAAPRFYGYGPGYGPGFADPRLERLRAAEAAGYLVVRRRTVEFPDGRFLRIYRPPGDGEPF